MRVLSFNIHKGFSLFRGKYLIPTLRELIRATNADIVFLQEILGFHPKDHNHLDFSNQFEYLADEMWPHYAYGKNAVYNKGHHGNAILSRFPIQNWENIDLSTNKMEQRGLLHCTVANPGAPNSKPLHLFCVHLNLFEKGRQAQVQKMIHHAHGGIEPDSPLIVAGDFNDWRKSLTEPLNSTHGLQEAFLQLHGRHQPTFPSFQPIFCLDRIYYRGVTPVTANTIGGGQLSDHLGLVVDFDW